jgi:hypothetical protein
MSRPIRGVQENVTPKEVRDTLREISRLLRSGTFTWDPPNVGAGTVVDTALPVATYPGLAGIVTGMPVKVTPPATLTAGLLVEGWASNTNELTVRLTNITAGAIDEPSAVWSYFGVTF